MKSVKCGAEKYHGEHVWKMDGKEVYCNGMGN